MPVWIERELLGTIQDAIRKTDGSTDVFYITSGGGEGKTVMLRQVGMALGSEDGIQAIFPYTGILDLYHSVINTNSGLEERLMEVLETASEFSEFRTERDIFTDRRRSGMLGPELEGERKKLALVFASCINRVSLWQRLVVAIDTTERIQYEVDEVQTLCDIPNESTTVREWLTTQLRLWKNCVVLLVGRPERDPYLGKALANSLHGTNQLTYHPIELGGFSPLEAETYFARATADPQSPDLSQALDPVFCERLYQATGGSPIRLELALEVARNGFEFEKFYQQVCEGTPDTIQREFDRLLVEYVFRAEPGRKENQILRYLAVTRKGLNADLLTFLVGAQDDGVDWQQALQAMERRFYIKRHPDEARLFLHDEIYQFCDQHLLNAAEVQALCQRIAHWYDQAIAAADSDSERQELEIESLLYRLRASPLDGYHWYVQKAEFAIRGAQSGYDLRLRNELMAFLKSDSPIDKTLLKDAPALEQEWLADSAANWVKRLTIRGDNDQAVRVFFRIEQLQLSLYPDTLAGCLSRADRDVFAGQAFVYSGRVEEGVRVLKEMIAREEGRKSPETLAREKLPSDYLIWRRNLILGRGHNNLGYGYWMYLWRLNLALKEFGCALTYFNVSDVKEEVANTSDNMARVHGLLRHQTRAEALVEEGLELRRGQRRSYREALSLVSKAIIHLEFGEPHRSSRLCQQALDKFIDLKTRRGEGLVKTVLGRTLRDLARQRPDVYPYAECLTMLTEAGRHLVEAKAIFTDQVKEPIRVIEAANELGCVFRERARVMMDIERDQGVEKASAITRGMSHKSVSAQAIQYLTEACALADAHQQPVWYIDTCEDLAEVHLLRQEYDLAEHWLNLAEARVPSTYQLVHGKFGRVKEQEKVEMYWQMLGKIEFARGELVFEREAGEAGQSPNREMVMRGLKHYMVSVTYFDKFSTKVSPALRTTFHHIFQRIKKLGFEDKLYLAQHGMREIADELHIKVDRFKEFYEGTVGLAIARE